MHTLLITIITRQRSIDLEVPAEVPVSILLPKLVELCEPQQRNQAKVNELMWQLRLLGVGTLINTTQSLLDAGVTDGAILVLQHVQVASTRQREARRSFVPGDVSPSVETGGIGVRWNAKGW